MSPSQVKLPLNIYRLYLSNLIPVVVGWRGYVYHGPLAWISRGTIMSTRIVRPGDRLVGPEANVGVQPNKDSRRGF